MADNRGSSGITLAVLVVASLVTAALLIHLHQMTDWSHGASHTAAIARIGLDPNRPRP
ncbi:MAG TPA: hypothetical protein VMU59_01360 [Caulobacteraceae bacterium]|nr:hypothetical protein [Caulobacteraceae bacterium]